MDDEKLIECVRSHPALYNLANPQYIDTQYKNYLWRKIAVELSFTENDWVICKQRWINIRDQYKKKIKSLKTTTGQAAKKIKLYKFHEQLQFLKGVDEDRDKKENFVKRSQMMLSPPSDVTPSTSNDSDINQQSNSHAQENFVERSQMMLSPPSDVTPSTSNDSDINQQSNSHAHNDDVASPSAVSPVADLPKQRQTNLRLKKKMSAPVPESASSTLMKYVLMNRNKNTEKEEQHSIDAFLQGLAPTLKSFSPYLQHVAKGKIFQVIHDLELQQITETLTSSPSTPIILSSPSPSSPLMSDISSPLSSYEQPETLDSIQLSEQPGSSKSVQLYFSQYDSANV